MPWAKAYDQRDANAECRRTTDAAGTVGSAPSSSNISFSKATSLQSSTSEGTSGGSSAVTMTGDDVGHRDVPRTSLEVERPLHEGGIKLA